MRPRRPASTAQLQSTDDDDAAMESSPPPDPSSPPPPDPFAEPLDTPSPPPPDPFAEPLDTPSPPPNGVSTSPPPNGVSTMQNLLHDTLHDTPEDAYSELKVLAPQNGFAVVKRRSTGYRIPELGNRYSRTDFECTLGVMVESQSTGRRQKPASRCGCRWSAYVRYCRDLAALGQKPWRLLVREDEHNHLPYQGELMAPYRRHQREDPVYERRLRQLCDMRELSGPGVVRQMALEFPGSTGVVPRDVNNFRHKEKVVRYQGRTPTQQFVLELRQMEQRGEAYLRLATKGHRPDGPIQYVFWTYHHCLEMWRDNWELLSIDNTYKTNRFNMPLAQVTGVTGMNTTFNVAWALMLNETEVSFAWVLRQLRAMTTIVPVPEPMVIISDYDSAFRAACRDVYPGVTTQICLWHVMKNVAYHIRMKWRGSLEGTDLGRRMAPRGGMRWEDDEDDAEDAEDVEEGDNDDEFGEREAELAADQLMDTPDRLVLGNGQIRRVGSQTQERERQRRPQPEGHRTWDNDADSMLRAWRDVVIAPTHRESTELWIKLQQEFPRQTAIIHYLRRTYLPVFDQFAMHVVKDIRNFGIRATSRTESTHATLKGLIRHRNGQMHDLHTAIAVLKNNQHRNIQLKLNDERKGYFVETQRPPFRELRGRVSYYALNQILDSERQAVKALQDRDRGLDVGNWNWICSGSYHAQ